MKAQFVLSVNMLEEISATIRPIVGEKMQREKLFYPGRAAREVRVLQEQALKILVSLIKSDPYVCYQYDRSPSEYCLIAGGYETSVSLWMST